MSVHQNHQQQHQYHQPSRVCKSHIPSTRKHLVKHISTLQAEKNELSCVCTPHARWLLDSNCSAIGINITVGPLHRIRFDSIHLGRNDTAIWYKKVN